MTPTYGHSIRARCARACRVAAGLLCMTLASAAQAQLHGSFAFDVAAMKVSYLPGPEGDPSLQAPDRWYQSGGGVVVLKRDGRRIASAQDSWHPTYPSDTPWFHDRALRVGSVPGAEGVVHTRGDAGGIYSATPDAPTAGRDSGRAVGTEGQRLQLYGEGTVVVSIPYRLEVGGDGAGTLGDVVARLEFLRYDLGDPGSFREGLSVSHDRPVVLRLSTAGPYGAVRTGWISYRVSYARPSDCEPWSCLGAPGGFSLRGTVSLSPATAPASPVPEPASALMAGLGAFGIVVATRRRRPARFTTADA